MFMQDKEERPKLMLDQFVEVKTSHEEYSQVLRRCVSVE